MSSKQGDSRNKIKIKKICICALLCTLCIIIGYIESLINLSFIAPGIKIGLSNAVALCLASSGNIKDAFAVNITRIFLSALLFGSPFSLIFSLTGGLFSLIAIALLARVKFFSLVGVSAVGGAVHNICQLGVAALLLGAGVFWYLPVLIVAGAVTGALVGIFSSVISKKIETNHIF